MAHAQNLIAIDAFFYHLNAALFKECPHSWFQWGVLLSLYGPTVILLPHRGQKSGINVECLSFLSMEKHNGIEKHVQQIYQFLKWWQ